MLLCRRKRILPCLFVHDMHAAHEPLLFSSLTSTSPKSEEMLSFAPDLLMMVAAVLFLLRLCCLCGGGAVRVKSEEVQV